MNGSSARSEPSVGILNYLRRRMKDPSYLRMWSEDPTVGGDAARVGVLLCVGRMMEPSWLRAEVELRKLREVWRACCP